MRLAQDTTPKHGKAPESLGWDLFEEESYKGPQQPLDSVVHTIPERRENSNSTSKKMQQAALVDLSAVIQTVWRASQVMPLQLHGNHR
jgi:hypothetical protein